MIVLVPDHCLSNYLAFLFYCFAFCVVSMLQSAKAFVLFFFFALLAVLSYFLSHLEERLAFVNRLCRFPIIDFSSSFQLLKTFSLLKHNISKLTLP